MSREVENNNSLASANSLELGQAVQGSLASRNDRDFYRLSATSSGTLTVSLDVPSTWGFFDAFRLSLFDSAGTLLNTYATGQDASFYLGLPAAGSYFLAVQSDLMHLSGNYSLSASLQAGLGGIESESNDTLASADALTLGSARRGQLSSRKDKDFFSLTATQAGVLSLAFDAPTESFLDTFQIDILDAQGRVMSALATGSDDVFRMAVGQAGDYFVAVSGGRWLHDQGSYTLKASLDNQGQALEQEPNDRTPNPLLDGQAISGQIASRQDKDLFTLQTTAASTLELRFDAPAASLLQGLHLSVLDDQGQVLLSRESAGDLNLSVNAPAAGVYTVMVRGGLWGAPSGSYTLSVSSRAQAELRESESNDKLASADAITLDQPLTGQLSSRSDADFYKLELAGSGQLQLSFDSPTDSSWARYFRVELLDAQGTLLLRRETGEDSAWSLPVSAGSVYVKVSNAGGMYHDGDYRLTLSAQLEDPIPTGAIVGTRLGDALTGTAGDDLIYGLGGDDVMDGGEGQDTAVFRAASASLSIQTIAGLSSVRGDFSAGEHAHAVSRLWQLELLRASDADIALETLAMAPRLGSLRADRLLGTAGDDLLDGLGGRDLIDGGAGADTLVLFGARSQFQVLSIAGITQVLGLQGSHEYAGVASTVLDVEALAFTQGATLSLPVNALRKVFGTHAADLLKGSDADEAFDGQGGKDTLDGGAGEDTLAVFARMDEFELRLPTATDPRLFVTGKAGSSQAGVQLVAVNMEQLAFADQALAIAVPAGLVTSLSSRFVAEGGRSTELWVSLSAAPTAAVSVAIDAGSQLSSSAASLDFGPDNWRVPQSVEISAVDDSLAEMQHSAQLSLSVASSDAAYAGLPAQTLSLSISDNEAPLLGRIGGQLWADLDKDGVLDAGEQPLPGWRVWTDSDRNGQWNATETSVLSDSAGRYWLDDLPAGAYTIATSPASGWAPTYPSLSTSSSTVLSNQAGNEALGVAPVASASLTMEQAQASYQGLGLATQMAAFRADPRFADLQGQGLSVVVLDTGIDVNHPTFGPDADGNGVADRIVYQYDFVGSNDADALDGQGHGTHVAGIIGSSDGSHSGIAPGVNLIVLKVLNDRGNGSAYDIQEAMNWVVANAREYNIAAVNLSLGDSSFYTSAARGYLSTQIQALSNSGVMVVAAAGNGYASNSRQGLAYPAADPYALSVGAVWAGSGSLGSWQTGSTDAIAYFSQRDDTESDIFAPGVFISSAQLDGSYTALSGTSMAAPEVAGMVTLAQQLALRDLGRRLSFDEMRSLLKQTGDTIRDGDDENDVVRNTGLDFKRIDMLALAEAILALKPAISHSVTLAAGQELAGKDFGFAPTTTVQALASDDVLVGSSYGEALSGGAGADLIDGGDGDDALAGEAGSDRLTGGAGRDRFVFHPGADGQDTITDLQADDVIEVAGVRLQSLGEGDGSAVLAGQAQMQAAYGQTLLYVGTDDVPGADLQVALQGSFGISQLSVSGSQIGMMEVDTTAPTVVFSDNQSGTVNLATLSTPSITYTLTFSEAVTGLDASDITLNVGRVTAVAGSGSSWTVTVGTGYLFTGKLQVTLKAGAVTDAAGNANALASDSSQAMDTEYPRTPSLSARGVTAPLVDPQVRFDTTLGSFTLELDPELAPLSTANMLGYVQADFYDNTLFHRIVNDPLPSGMQIVQGGGLAAGLVAKTTGGPIALESDNGLSNVRGSVAMARGSGADTGTSQFFINVQDNLFLDYVNQATPQYAVFGKVVAGMDVIDAMAAKPVKTVGGYENVPVTDIVVSQSNVVQEPSTVYSRSGVLDVGRLETGGRWIYSIDGGVTALTSTAAQLSLAEGRYAVGDILIQQSDAANNTSKPTLYGRTLVVDKTAPQVTQLNPVDGASSIHPARDLVLTFSEDIQVGSGQLLLKTAAGQSVATYTSGDAALQVQGKTLTLNPATNLSLNTSYTLSWTEGAVTDLAGNPLAAGSGYDFSTADSAARFWKSPTLAPANSQTRSAVDLQDAIAVLKMIVGLPVNTGNVALSPYQAIAADFDQNGAVELSDAIAILKMVVDLPVSAQPSWKYYEASLLPASLSLGQGTDLSGWLPPAAQATQASASVDIVGVLTGDVDGSWLPA